MNCSATVAKMIASRSAALAEEFSNVDGVVALTHGTGCGMAADGDGIRLLRRTLNGYARHPNFAALLVVGLGCGCCWRSPRAAERLPKSSAPAMMTSPPWQIGAVL
ncbi:UxaA family hydrolase [Actinoallomurus purpureus]|nr:UxaA family hydrolase [Actinoallomurus purpureus]